MAAPTILPDYQVNDGSGNDTTWIVTVYNNDHNTFDEVVTILMLATHCLVDEAEMETWEIDRLGRSVVHHGAESDCRTAAEIISTIGIEVHVSQE